MAQSSKKGNLGFDLLIVIGALTVFAFVIIMLYVIQDAVNDEVQDDTEIPTNVKAISQTHTENYVSVFDNGFVFFFILLWIALLITSFFIDTHPIFFVITIILMVFIIIFAASMSNYYEEFLDDEDMVEFSLTFPKINYIMAHLVEFIIAMFATTGIALFAKNQMGGP